jgi:hypothetical protein
LFCTDAQKLGDVMNQDGTSEVLSLKVPFGEAAALRGLLAAVEFGNYGPTHPISQARKCKLSSVLLLIVVN